MSRSRLVVLGVFAQGQPLGHLAVRSDHSYHEHADLSAVAQTLVRLRDVYRHPVVSLCL